MINPGTISSIRRVALAGNPNTGKSSLFNRLTGASERVGNYPGVTVERKTGWCTCPNGKRLHIVDLPGCYSMTARSPDEEVAHHELVGLYDTNSCDAIVVVLDASNLARNLYLTLQLLEYGRPVVIALNMVDVATGAGQQVDVRKLEQSLGVPVVPIAAHNGWGIHTLLTRLETLDAAALTPPQPFLSSTDERVVERTRKILEEHNRHHCPGHALWLLTSDKTQLQHLPDPLQKFVLKERQALDEQFQSQPKHTLHFRQRAIVTRYAQIDAIVTECVTHARTPPRLRSDAIDKVLLHPVWGLVVFAATMLLIFQLVFFWAEPFMNGVDAGIVAIQGALHSHLAEGPLREFLVEGVLSGVGMVLVFLPQIIFLFTILTLLEDSGYMARAAFLLDGMMRRVGLHGQAFVPLMSSFACAIPGIMSARSIGSRRSRILTILIAPLMSCSARLPVYLLVTAAVFSNTAPVWGVFNLAGLVIAAMYLLGLFTAFLVAFALKKTVLSGPVPPLLLELPSYKRPSVRTVARIVYRKARVFVVHTGRVILALSILMWAAITYPKTEYSEAERQQKLEELTSSMSETEAKTQLAYEENQLNLENSIAGRAGRFIEPVIKPLGFDWKIGIGLIGSFAAREVLVSTLGQVYGVSTDDEQEDKDFQSLRNRLLDERDPHTGESTFNIPVGLSLMVFFVIAMQCLSTVAIIRRETNSWVWPIASLFGLNLLAWLASFATYQIALLVTG